MKGGSSCDNLFRQIIPPMCSDVPICFLSGWKSTTFWTHISTWQSCMIVMTGAKHYIGGSREVSYSEKYICLIAHNEWYLTKEGIDSQWNLRRWYDTWSNFCTEAATEQESQLAFWWSQWEENIGKSLSKIKIKDIFCWLSKHVLTTEVYCQKWIQDISDYLQFARGLHQYKYISGGKDGNLDLDRNHITLHFEILSCILLSLIQTASWDKSLDIFCWTTAWVIPEQIKAVSSANWRSLP